jgi:hypothetical protein
MIASVFISLACVVVLGTVLIYLFPAMHVDTLRKHLNQLVLAIFLPALNFKVIYTAKIGMEFWQLPLIALGGLLLSLAVGAASYAFLSINGRQKGALVIACAFSNVTYFGIAVLQGLFPEHLIEVLTVAILFEITITPMNLIVGSALASAYGEGRFLLKKTVLDVIKLPLLWSTFIALFLNLARVTVPSFILDGANLLASAVSGLMILSLGMALKYPVLKLALRRIHILLPVAIVKLLLSPLFVYFGVRLFGVEFPYSAAAVIEAAMPSQLISLAIVDRFDLDVEILAIAISFDTALSFITIPAIHSWLNA